MPDVEPRLWSETRSTDPVSGAMTILGHYHVLLHLAALTSVAALALRDQIRLRAVLLLSVTIALVNNYDGAATPDWEGLFWNLVLFAINLSVLVLLALDRTHIGLSAEERSLFEALEILTPGEFRTLIRLASWHVAAADQAITREGEVPGSLFYVMSGGISIEKGGRVIDYGPRTFIGEIAFLQRGPASATVRLRDGSRYVAWTTASLDRRIEGRQQLRHAVTRLISHDMALKVGRA